MVPGLRVSQLEAEAMIEQDPRLREVEKYWLQLSSYDLDKLIQLYRLRPFTNNGLDSIEATISIQVRLTQADNQRN